jgi:hypothetical protein
VSADRGLYEAALALQDGEIGPEPVREGERFAVIWRRGSLPAALPDEAGRQAAAAALREKKTEEGLSQLLEGLGKDIQGRNDEPLGKLRRKEARLFVDP